MTEPTTKQIAFLSKHGVKNPWELTKEESSDKIAEIIGKQEGAAISKPVKVAENAPKGQFKPYNGEAMYVSYVKDLVVAGKELDEAIAIIKTAKEAFS